MYNKKHKDHKKELKRIKKRVNDYLSKFIKINFL